MFFHSLAELVKVPKASLMWEAVWSGLSRWLYSCSQSVPCSTNVCFTYTQLTWLTFLHTCPRPQLVIVLIFRSESLHLESLSKAWWGADASASFPGNRWAKLTSIPPITGNVPPPSGSKDGGYLRPRWRVPRGRRLRQVRNPPTPPQPPSTKPLVSLSLTPALPSVLSLDKYRACRPVRCSSTEALRLLI